MSTTVHDSLKEYYGKVLSKSSDLQTNACCCDAEAMPDTIKGILGQIHPAITERFYGCGSPIPPLLEGLTVLDLGCGTGRDVFLLSGLVGETGRVIGVDMTDEQLALARAHVGYHTDTFGYAQPNVEFRQGFIEDLAEIGIDDDSVDVVVSNCVINLSPDKQAVFREILRVLKPGGELYFSDIFADRRIPERLRQDPVLHGECLGGAMYIEDFRRLLAGLGCPDFRITSSAPVTIDNPAIEKKIGMVGFCSLTVRAFKLDDLEDMHENYGQSAVYKGGIPGHVQSFDLDDQHRFVTGNPMSICGNTAAMLQHSRYAAHFEVRGDRSRHYGRFDSAPAGDSDVASASAKSCC
jgi:arsenite methyltransferase